MNDPLELARQMRMRSVVPPGSSMAATLQGNAVGNVPAPGANPADRMAQPNHQLPGAGQTYADMQRVIKTRALKNGYMDYAKNKKPNQKNPFQE
jgi:hypothetical protein